MGGKIYTFKCMAQCVVCHVKCTVYNELTDTQSCNCHSNENSTLPSPLQTVPPCGQPLQRPAPGHCRSDFCLSFLFQVP